MLGISEDITKRLAIKKQLKQQQKTLHHMANLDALTGLSNRVLLKDRMAHSIQEIERDAEKFVFLFVDFDRFKLISVS